MPTALLGGRAVDIPGTTLSLIAGSSIMFFGFAIAFILLAASVGFWPVRSSNSKVLKRPALIVVSVIYLVGACGIGIAGTVLYGVAYVKSHTHATVRNTEISTILQRCDQ